MEKGNFDRMEDMGVFFGKQLLDEYMEKGEITKGIRDVHEFLWGYEKKNIENGGLKMSDIYRHGCPISFFIAIWVLMDTYEQVMVSHDGDFSAPETQKRVDFVFHILNNDFFVFPE